MTEKKIVPLKYFPVDTDNAHMKKLIFLVCLSICFGSFAQNRISGGGDGGGGDEEIETREQEVHQAEQVIEEERKAEEERLKDVLRGAREVVNLVIDNWSTCYPQDKKPKFWGLLGLNDYLQAKMINSITELKTNNELVASCHNPLTFKQAGFQCLITKDVKEKLIYITKDKEKFKRIVKIQSMSAASSYKIDDMYDFFVAISEAK